MRILRCDICKTTANPPTVKGLNDRPQTWTTGFISTPSGSGEFDLCPLCAPKFTKNLEKYISARKNAGAIT